MSDELLKPGEVATMLRVDPRTVSRWARKGKIPFITTPGGHVRLRKSTVDAILSGEVAQPDGEE